MLTSIRHTPALILGSVLVAMNVACGNAAVIPLDKGVDYAEQGDYEKAIEQFDEAVRLDPQDAKAYGNRGSAYSALGKYQQAIQDYDEAIRLRPQLAGAYYIRGLIYGELGKSDEAARDFAKAKELGYDP